MLLLVASQVLLLEPALQERLDLQCSHTAMQQQQQMCDARLRDILLFLQPVRNTGDQECACSTVVASFQAYTLSTAAAALASFHKAGSNKQCCSYQQFPTANLSLLSVINN